MKRVKQLIMGLAIVLGIGVLALPVSPASAVDVDPIGVACEDPANAQSEICKSQDDNIGAIMNTVINVLLYIVGAISVIMIIVGGIMYATSAGDPSTATKAKNTILYAVIGLVIAFLAFALVNWVLDIFTQAPPATPSGGGGGGAGSPRAI